MFRKNVVKKSMTFRVRLPDGGDPVEITVQAESYDAGVLMLPKDAEIISYREEEKGATK